MSKYRNTVALLLTLAASTALAENHSAPAPAAAAPAASAPADAAPATATPVAASATDAAAAAAQSLGLGRVALPEEVAAWNKDVLPDGTGLPEGSGDVATGEAVYLENCASCHGDFAEGLDNWPSLAGGIGTLADRDPEKTVGSYFPYLSTVWDYIHRSMPFGNAQILTPDDTYAIVAYLLYSNDLVEEDFVLSKDNFLEVEMPNADGFIEDDRAKVEYPKFAAEQACMENCKDTVEITMRASVLDVTPGGADDGEEQVEEAADAVGLN